MHYVIMGCGRVGTHLAKGLIKRGHTVAVIDLKESAFQRLGADFTGEKIIGSGYDKETLKKARIHQAHGFAAVSNGDNSNIIAARVVRETFGLENVVARIYDHARAEVYERLGINTIASVRWTTEQMLHFLTPGRTQMVWQDNYGAVQLVEIAPHSSWVGLTILEIRKAIKAPIPFITRMGHGMVTDFEVVVQDGDLLYVALSTEQVNAIEQKLTQPRPEPESDEEE